MRPLSKSVLVFAILLTTAVFLLGLWLGSFIAEAKFSQLERDIGLSLDRANILFTLPEEEFCSFYPYFRPVLEEERDALGGKLDYLEKIGELDIKLKERYFYMEYRNFLLGERYNRECNGGVRQALYFYGTDCPTCLAFGRELDRIRAEKNITVYAFDLSLPFPISKALGKKYPYQLPFLVYEGQVYRGLEGLKAFSGNGSHGSP